ncbi:MAG: alpha-glucosidase/alpha-galactosidase [Anaerolineae bacterium]|nr:alpha-glucosidase/alpha-galactosidase [Anaerolineae bacterium]
MRSTKIVLIGAASASFGPAMIADAALSPELSGSTLCLVDIDGERLEVMAGFARRVNEATGAGLRIEHTTDRARALPGAEFVITSIAVRRDELWKLDFQIPLKHGIKQVLGENGGPGGLSHSLRNIPIVLDIARDVERLAPRALVMNFTNPESRICLALSRYTGVRFVGLCHGIGMGYDSIGVITGIPADDLVGIAAGLNHFAWFLDIRRRSTHEDVYPLLRAADATHDPGYYPLTRRMFRLYGLYPHPSDDHIGEYLSFAWETCGLHGYDFSRADEWRERSWARIARIARGEEKVPLPEGAGGSGEERLQEDRLRLRRSGEFAFPIILATLGNRQELIEAVNIRNEGLIDNVPAWAVVEVPAVVGADGVKGVHVGALPAGVAALVNTQAHVQDLVVEAAVQGSRELALQALLADPVVESAEAAERTLDELLHVHLPYLPQFKR